MSSVTGFRVSPQQAAWWQQQQRGQTHNAGVWLHVNLRHAPEEHTFRERLRTLIAHEEILRTRLHVVPGMSLPVQVIEETADIPLEIVDWRNVIPAEQTRLSDTLRQLIEKDKTEDNMPLRLWLAQITDQQWGLLLKASASHLDVTSLWLLAQALISDAEPQDRLQYADYAEWKHNLREEAPDNAGLVHWQQQQPDMSAPLLPGLSNIASQQNPALAFVTLDLGLNVHGIQQRANSLSITVDDYLFCAFSILLARLRGQTQLQLVWIDDGRGEGLENAFGFFEQALPIPLTIDPALSLHDQLQNLIKPLSAAKGWRDYFHDDKESDSSRQIDRSPTNCAYFSVRHLSPQEAFSYGQTFTVQPVFTLGLDCVAVGEESLHCRLAYDTTKFDANALTCLCEQWQRLLHGLSDQTVPLGAIGLLGEQQKQLLTPPPAPSIEPVSLVELIERQARLCPEAPALADCNGVLNYRELSARSNQFARYLLNAGVQVGDSVGLLLPRGNSMIIAMLAVFKAGAAYVPLDPNYPSDRLRYMTEDSGARLIVTVATHQQLVADGVQTLLLDSTADDWSKLPNDHLEPLTDLQLPAYLIYTSGSTGQPKAVEISHANLSHSTQVRMSYYGEPVKAYLLLSSFAFDSSVAGIFWTLAQGGLLVLPANGEELDLAALTALVRRHRVSHSLSLPSLYETLLDYADRESLESLSTWIVAGEACAPHVLTKHRQCVPQARLFNEYGPTEATVWATAACLTNNTSTSTSTDDVGSNISIGQPIPSMQFFLVNEQGAHAAIGEPGEIQLGGPSLSRGYRGRPEQTARAFVISPDIANGARRYKTGDVARWRLDGCLDFLGRADHQVKIRGYRVELGEIERLLMEHSEVRDAVVVALDHSKGIHFKGSHSKGNHASGKRLVAYVTDRLGYAPNTAALSSYLGDRLPAYMVPSAFMHLKEFPRTPNGKVDIKALPDSEQISGSTAYVAPRDEMEADLAAICVDVLRRERIGVLDNFFHNGGDSIQSLQIVARAHQRGIRLTTKQVFESETIARMALVATHIADAGDMIAANSISKVMCGEETLGEDNGVDLSLAGLDESEFQSLLTELEGI